MIDVPDLAAAIQMDGDVRDPDALLLKCWCVHTVFCGEIFLSCRTEEE